MKKQFLLLIILFFIALQSDAQIGVGKNQIEQSAIVDLDVSSLPVNGKKGFLGPRVALKNPTDVLTIPNPAIGLSVYNLGTEPTFTIKGYLFWNGTEWRTFENLTTVPATLSQINCDSAKLTPQAYTLGVPFVGTLSLPYSNGNGGSYLDGSPITVNGLTFKLQEGRLENGSGNLIFKVTGTPTVSSPTRTNVEMNSTLISFYTGASCNVSVGSTNADIQFSVVIGPLTSDGSVGWDYVYGVNRILWTKEITTPDGKFSIRFLEAEPYQLQYTDIQIRSNGSGTPPTIMWNSNVNSVFDGTFSNGNNSSTFPANGVWYGNDGGNGSIFYTFNTAFFPGWGNQDVYNSSPEYRRYTWTSKDFADQTVYTLTAFMGASNPAGTTPAEYANTKCYLKIEQVKAN